MTGPLQWLRGALIQTVIYRRYKLGRGGDNGIPNLPVLKLLSPDRLGHGLFKGNGEPEDNRGPTAQRKQGIWPKEIPVRVCVINSLILKIQDICCESFELFAVRLAHEIIISF